MKILTSRLSNILSINKMVLGDNNHADLPGKSTIEPIHILNNVMEEAREKSKELWILLQDMSKAYDLVNRENLWKAMRRIRIPDHFITIIDNSFKYRTNQVITDVGLTNEYNMNNGIDQGEIMSPLLWIIYYDPLFSKIKKIKGIGYTMEHSWKRDLSFHTMETRTLEIFNLVFMDDTNWLSGSKRGLTKQLIVTEKFNRYNGTKVNPDKSKLIVINNSKTIEEKYIRYGVKNNTKIYPEKPNSLVRFLGVWISEKNNKKFVFDQIIRNVNIIFGLTSRKKLSPEQIKYVINAIVILRIEYKSHLTIFTEYEANRVTAKLRQVIKQKMNCSNTIPTVFLKNHNVYKLINFFERQAENHINNLIIKLNDDGFLGLTSEIRLRQLQNAEWLYDNLLKIWNYNNINSFK